MAVCYLEVALEVQVKMTVILVSKRNDNERGLQAGTARPQEDQF